MFLHRHGFTLVELAIVLVIIGLLVGGVLVGKDLIEAAAMRRQITQVDKLSQGAAAFRLKYHCIPGDCINARNFMGGASQPDQVSNGNGNGIIDRDGVSNACVYRWANGNEWQYVFDQLAAAKMVSHGQYDETSVTNNLPGLGYPLCAWEATGDTLTNPIVAGANQCGVILSHEFKRHYFRIGAMPRNPGQQYLSFENGYRPADASRFDRKFDDALPLSGFIQAATYSTYHCASTAAGVAAGFGDGRDLTTNASYGIMSASNCANAAGTAYNGTTSNWRYCSFRINAGF